MLAIFLVNSDWKYSRSETHGTLKPVALAILNQVVDDQDAQEEDDSLESLEVQGHWLVHDPAQDDEEWSDEDRNLKRASDRDTDSQIHFALVSDHTGRDVFCCVSDNWKKNETNESLGDMGGFDNGVNAIHEVFGTDSNHKRHNYQCHTRTPWRQNLTLFLLIRALLILLIEQVVVSLELEEQVHDV